MEVIAVFAGSSLPPHDRGSSTRTAFLPPAARGEVLQAAKTYPIVVLIDGVVDKHLEPSAAEIRASLQYAKILGAASFGAVRSVQCRADGARPLGIIAQWYSAGRIDPRELALAVDPCSHTALSVPLVNVRWALRVGQRRGLIDAADANRTVEHARGIHFLQRTWEGALAPLPNAARNALLAFSEHVNLQRLDALFALHTALRLLLRGGH